MVREDFLSIMAVLTFLRLDMLDLSSRLLLLPTCLTERAARCYHHNRDSNGTYKTYAEPRAAFKACFTPPEAERKSLKVKPWALKQREEESVIDFNHRFETMASCCTLGDNEAKDIYLDCLGVKLREVLAIRTPETLPQAMKNAISVNVIYSRLGK